MCSRYGCDPVVTRRSKHTVGMARAIDAVEAAYSLDGTTEAWLARLLQAVAPDLDLGAGTYAFTVRSSEDPRLRPDSELATRGLDPGYLGVLAELNEAVPGEVLDLVARTLVSCGALEQIFGDGPANRIFRDVAGRVGIVDGFSMFAHDGELGGIVMSAPSRAVLRLSGPTLHVWTRIGLHVAAALRLRRKILEGTSSVEALVSPGGEVAHAEGTVRTDGDVRARLRLAVKRVEQARTKAVRADPAHALTLWRGLVDGRWSLVDRWESDGKRYVAVHANPPSGKDPRALTEREAAVLSYAVRSASDKEIAFALGLPAGTVATIIRRVVHKLGCRRRVDLIGFDRAESLIVPTADVEVLRSGIDRASPRLAVLTPEEREIVELVVCGATNAEIARARRKTRKTIDNQLYRIYGKLGVESRAELVRDAVQPAPR